MIGRTRYGLSNLPCKRITRQNAFMKRSILVVVLVTAFGSLGYAWFDLPGARHLVEWLPGGDAEASPQFMTAPVERGTVRRTVTTTGTLQALVTVEVGTQLSGQIAGLFADFNDASNQPPSIQHGLAVRPAIKTNITNAFSGFLEDYDAAATADALIASFT